MGKRQVNTPTDRALKAMQAKLATFSDPGVCWPYPGQRTHLGYGIVYMMERRKRRTMQAHRLAYTASVGPIPEGLVVRHKCDNRPCINPTHLELGTQADNIRDMRKRTGYSPHHKLTWDDVNAIRHAATLGATHAHLARHYGVTQSNVSHVVRGNTWRPEDYTP